jgi:hypothetical protein
LSEVERLEKQFGRMSFLQTDLAIKIRHFLDAADEEPVDSSLNEVFLLHGTKPEALHAVLANGPSEKFSDGLFGQGAYFAENPCKNDQYVSKDATYHGNDMASDLHLLHKALYRKVKHPGDVYYIILCRVVMGRYVRTQQPPVDMDAGGSIWASLERELAQIPSTNPPIHYHALVAELGAKIMRHREFLQYHHARIYPAYLIAYHRKLHGQRI